MTENKKSFILYCDYQEVFNTLTDKEAGQLIKHILSYVNDENPADLENRMLKIAFEPIKLQLKRDLARWEDFKKRQADNGKKGGRPEKPKNPPVNLETQNNPENPSLFLGSLEKPTETQKSLNVTVTDTVTVNGSVITPPVSEKQKQVEQFFIGVGGTIEQAGKFYRYYDGKLGFENLNNWTQLAQNWYLEDVERAKKVKQLEKPTW